MNNSAKRQPRKVYFSVEQVAWKMKVSHQHIIDIIKIFGIRPKTKKGVIKLVVSEIEIFYRIQLLRDWGHSDNEISDKKLYTDLPFAQIFNDKKASEIEQRK